VLLVEFASYIWFFYYIHTLLDENQIPDMKPVLVALGFLQALLLIRVTNRNQLLKELRIIAQETILKNEVNEQKQPYIIYANISILIYLTPALVFASIYLLEAVYTPSEKLKLSESFVGLVIIPFILATVNHIAAILRSQKKGIAWIIETAFGSSIRILLFMFLFAVIFG
jgi:calcium/proton exchanger cax